VRSLCCLCDCLSVSPSPVIIFEWLNQSLWNVACTSWYPSPSQRHTSQIHPNSLYEYVCIGTCLSLLGNVSVKTLPRQRGNTRRTVSRVVSYAIHVVPKERTQLVLPRTSCTWYIFPCAKHSKKKKDKLILITRVESVIRLALHNRFHVTVKGV
jgi:hypothetical protein